MDRETAQVENVGGYVVPVDPMDEMGCDSCQ
ncbi:ribonucleotide-diphosphate reductase subunit beta (plasmid) [Streptomyces sp. L7]